MPCGTPNLSISSMIPLAQCTAKRQYLLEYMYAHFPDYRSNRGNNAMITLSFDRTAKSTTTELLSSTGS